ncbi:patatin-like phospholipase domain-containing protein 2 [Oryzias melastigma]|uniref:triacylglycerol lipase n=1 Tax=Oryzias melastigma TaxID=30732 RepID=A0A3B3D0Z3_ORYME|nr:patatin-like phospholipase domain-containing protein 2 [Oryzias melastigma]
MFNWSEEWNISFSGCGFRSIYYVGVLSCILERAPQLVHGAAKIGGASSGCLVAAAVTVGTPMEQLCLDILTTAKEARKQGLGVFHPSFCLLRTVQRSLLDRIPDDAHLRASGRLCVSLTRLMDGENVLVSEFASREELIQVLMCSCFFPVYCGSTPPSYRGVNYMDGALSNSMPLFELRNTITVAPFSGESDICPTEGTFNFFEANYGNVSIQVNTGNVHRVCTSFLPPPPEMLAEICHNGYMDALCFLIKRGLSSTECNPCNLLLEEHRAKPPCCDLVKEKRKMKKMLLTEGNHQHQEHWWLDPKVIENLPSGIKKVLCEVCRDAREANSWWSQTTDFLPVKIFLFPLTLLVVSLQFALFVVKSVTIIFMNRPPQTADGIRRAPQTYTEHQRDPLKMTGQQSSSTSSDSAVS